MWKNKGEFEGCTYDMGVLYYCTCISHKIPFSSAVNSATLQQYKNKHFFLKYYSLHAIKIFLLYESNL